MNFVRYFLTGLSTRRWNDTAILFLRLFIGAMMLTHGMFVATFVAFPDKSFADGELSFVYMGIYIFLIISGGGEYSLDRLFFAAGQDDK